MRARDAKSPLALGFLTVTQHPQWGLIGGYLVLNALGRPLEFHCTAPVRPTRAQRILYGPTLEPYLYGEQIGQALVTKASTAAVAICTDRTAVLAVSEFVSMPVLLVLDAAASEASARRDENDEASARLALEVRDERDQRDQRDQRDDRDQTTQRDGREIVEPLAAVDRAHAIESASDPAREAAARERAGTSSRLDPSHGATVPLAHFSIGDWRLAVSAAQESAARGVTEQLIAASRSIDLGEPFGRIREAIAEAQRSAAR